MKDGKNYDLPTLLKLGDLDIRGIAAKNRTLLVTEYFNSITKFIDDTPAVMEGLAQITELTADENVFRSILDMKSLLTGIGGDKLISVIDGILDAGKKNNKEVAAICAEKVLADFSKLYNRTKTAEVIPKASKLLTTSAGYPNGERSNKLPLRVRLEQLEREEASRKLRILAVDDASIMLSTISTILKNDYEVFSLTKGALVEKFLRHTMPELFLLDYTMPEINGFELIPIIRSFEEHKETPIIFLTAMGTAYHVKEAFSLGACDYVVKPVSAEILREKVAKHIVRKKAF